LPTDGAVKDAIGAVQMAVTKRRIHGGWKAMETRDNRILAVGAHPDDVEFMCSGTLKLLKDRGYEISICVLSNGDCGSMIEPSESITRIRREEAITAAKLLDAAFYPLGEYDLRFEVDNRNKMKVTEIIRATDPLIVLTHAHEDYMADHEVTSRLVRTACFAAPVPNYFTYSVSPQPRTSRIPYLYYAAPIDGRDIYGNWVDQGIYVNVAAAMKLKCDMLACHRSQRDWLRQQHGMDQYIESMKNTAGEFGEKAGCAYAEGFRQHLGHAYPQDNILKGILGDLVSELGKAV
jgi:LmbE family N-acetylglucosaminyl deacetylase